MEKISNQFHQGTPAMIDLLVIFTGIALKFENFAQFFPVSVRVRSCHR